MCGSVVMSTGHHLTGIIVGAVFCACLFHIHGIDVVERGDGECSAGGGGSCSDPVTLLQRRLNVDAVADASSEDPASKVAILDAGALSAISAPKSAESGFAWLPLSAPLNPDELTVASYAGKDKQVYIDMVAMLGLAVQEQLPEAQRVCIVVKGISQEYQDILKGAGWTLLEVDNFKPKHGPGGYWSEVYNKVNFFRLPFQRVLALDADTTLLNGDSVRSLLQTAKLPKGHIGMVKDCCNNNFNSGVMLIQPDLSIYTTIMKLMQSKSGSEALDQPIINEAYGDGDMITPLPDIFNVHGYSDKCSEATIAHFTGSDKPTTPEVDFLQQIRSGDIRAITGFPCPSLYVKFFRKLKEKKSFLTKTLQAALDEVDDTGLPPGPPVSCLSKDASREQPPMLLQTKAEVEAEPAKENSEVFDNIYKKHLWGGDGVKSSLSGGGSSEAASRVPCKMIHWLVHKLVARENQLSDVSTGSPGDDTESDGTGKGGSDGKGKGKGGSSIVSFEEGEGTFWPFTAGDSEEGGDDTEKDGTGKGGSDGKGKGKGGSSIVSFGEGQGTFWPFTGDDTESDGTGKGGSDGKGKGKGGSSIVSFEEGEGVFTEGPESGKGKGKGSSIALAEEMWTPEELKNKWQQYVREESGDGKGKGKGGSSISGIGGTLIENEWFPFLEAETLMTTKWKRTSKEQVKVEMVEKAKVGVALQGKEAL